MGISKGMDVKSVWNYSDRTLTQVKFPFWSEVIIHNSTYGNVDASSYIDVTIQPSSGETWELYVLCGLNSNDSGSYLAISTMPENKIIVKNLTRGSYGLVQPYIQFNDICNNSHYFKMTFFNNGSGSRGYGYNYSGYKLGTKVAKFEDVNKSSKALINGERPTKFKIRSEFEGLEDIIRDVYDSEDDDYKQVIYFYKDRAIRRDKRTGHVIERASSYIETDKLIENLEKIKTGEMDLEKTGYKTWIEQIRKERGIDLLGRL